MIADFANRWYFLSLLYQIPEMEITRELGLQVDSSSIDSNDKGNLILIMEEKAARSYRTQQLILHTNIIKDFIFNQIY